MGFRLTPAGGWAALAATVEDRALPAADVQPAYPSLTTSAPPNVTTSNALRVSDAYACVRCSPNAAGSTAVEEDVYFYNPADRCYY